MTSSFPTSGWAVIGALLFLISGGVSWGGRWAAKTMKELREENKELHDENKELYEKVMTVVIPAVAESTAATRQAFQQLAANEAVARDRRQR